MIERTFHVRSDLAQEMECCIVLQNTLLKVKLEMGAIFFKLSVVFLPSMYACDSFKKGRTEFLNSKKTMTEQMLFSVLFQRMD